jgi:hypothetical protein
MKTNRSIPHKTFLAAALLLSAAMAFAQGGPGPGGGMGGGPRMQGAGPAASAPGMGPGMGMGPASGPRGGRHMAARWGGEFTPGWALMTETERKEHSERMRAMKSHEECQAYVAQHREQMATRAKERGKTLPTPRRGACAALKP